MVPTQSYYHYIWYDAIWIKGVRLQACVYELWIWLLIIFSGKVEDTHNDLVKRNQQIATLEANLMRTEQKKFTFEKELLVSNEKISSLESNIRSLKDENRADKKSIATLEVRLGVLGIGN